ncbi:MAG: VaFE repeat-containing surface-anchored protein [Parasporobacterium sp.]|nr:VaFE repeat-containing surface-anchored protein [Parasporobacterium sp.]
MKKGESITKRILPLVLCTILCLGLASGAFAADDPEEGYETEIESTAEMKAQDSEAAEDSISAPEDNKDVPEQSDSRETGEDKKPIDETKGSSTEEGMVQIEESKPEKQPRIEPEDSCAPKENGKTSDREEDENLKDTAKENASDKEEDPDRKDSPEDGTKEEPCAKGQETKEEPEDPKAEDKTETKEKEDNEAKGETETKKAFLKLPDKMFISKSVLSGIDFSSARLLVDGSIIDPENELSSYDGIHLMQYETPETAKNAYAYYYGRSAFVEADSSVHIANGRGGAVGAFKMTEGDTPLDKLASAPAMSGFDIALIDTGADYGVDARVSMIGDNLADENGHGTRMAEIIRSENPEASIVSIKALDADGSGDVSAVYAAIRYATQAHVSIIHLSICTPKKADSAAIISAVDEALANGITVIAAAGNYGNNASYYIPGGISGVLTIGACNEKGVMLGISNYGNCVDFNAVGETTSQAAARFTGIYSRTRNAEADYEKIFPAGYVPEEEPLEKWISLGIGEVDAMAGQQSESCVFKIQSTATIVEKEMYSFYDAAAPHLTDTSGNLIYCILPWSIAPNGVTADFNDYNIGRESSENLMLMAKILYYGYGGGENILTGSAHEQEAITHFALSYVWLSLMGNTHGGPDWTVTGSSSLNAAGQALVMNYMNQVRNLPDVTGDLHIASLYEASGETYQDLAFGHFEAPRGKVRVKKSSLNTDITNENNCYSLQGAVFGLYSSQSEANSAASLGKKTGGEVTTLSSNAYGLTPYSDALDTGTYYLAEITAPKGYKRSTSVKSVTLSAGDEKEISFADEPLNDPVGVAIEKIPKGTITSEEDMSDAHYEVKFYAGDNNGIPYTKSTLPQEASATWMIRTIKTPQNKYIAQLDDNHIISGTAKYGKTSSGSYHIPLGTITIEETKAPAGFTIKGSTMELAGGNGADATEGVILMNLIDERSSVYVKSGNQVSDASDGFKILSREMPLYPEVRTSAVDGETKEHIGSLNQPVIVDTVKLSNLVAGRTYTVLGKLMDKKTGKAIKNATGEEAISKTEPFEATDTEMTVELTFETGRDNLAGRTVAVFEDLIHNDVVVAAHADLEDENQSVHYPKIHTAAAADDTKDHVTKAKKEVTIADTVSYTNLVPGKTYRLKGVLADQTNGTPIKIDGKEITAEKEFTPKETNGTVEMAFTFDASALAGTTAVAFETLYYEDVIVAVHEDVKDKDQTVYIPKIKTSIKDALTQIDHTKADEKTVVIDTVTYKNLYPGKEYVMKGVLVNKATGEPVTVNGTQITAEQAFTPKTEDGTVNMTFAFNASVLQGKTIVAFERCFYNDIEVAIHADIEDEDQTEYIPKIGTTAIANDTKDHVASAAESLTIIDTVSYQGLKPNTKYIVNGVLMDQKNGGPFRVNGEEVTGSTTFVTGDKGEGTVEVRFTFNASACEDKTVVVFERLYREDKLVAAHEEITEEGQAVHITDIHTEAFDVATKDHDGSVGEKITIQDNVYFSNLIPGKQYLVSGKLMEKESGMELLTDNKPVTAKTYFIPKQADGCVVLKFELDSRGLKGKSLVAFEEISFNSIPIAIHADINDKEQTINFIEICTTAVDHNNGTKEMSVGKETVLTDTVSYKNLTPEKEYILKGEVMDKETGEGIGVASEEIFQPGQDPDGEISMDFILNTEKLQGRSLVVFERLYDSKGNLLAEHADINDGGQTVTVPDKPETSKKPQTPYTGDGNSMIPWFILIAGSVAAGATAVVRMRKKPIRPGKSA